MGGYTHNTDKQKEENIKIYSKTKETLDDLNKLGVRYNIRNLHPEIKAREGGSGRRRRANCCICQK